jgi:hypothetical protein
VSEGLEVARLFLSDGVPIVLTQSKAMAADPPKALTTAASRLPLTGVTYGHSMIRSADNTVASLLANEGDDVCWVHVSNVVISADGGHNILHHVE